MFSKNAFCGAKARFRMFAAMISSGVQVEVFTPLLMKFFENSIIEFNFRIQFENSKTDFNNSALFLVYPHFVFCSQVHFVWCTVQLSPSTACLLPSKALNPALSFVRVLNDLNTNKMCNFQFFRLKRIYFFSFTEKIGYMYKGNDNVNM